MTSGNLTITAVPELSTSLAAAGLVGLLLWAARRHLFKAAGSRSALSGHRGKGADGPAGRG